MKQVPPKRQMIFNRLHGVVSQKTELFITTAVRTSNPIYLLYVQKLTHETIYKIILHNYLSHSRPHKALSTHVSFYLWWKCTIDTSKLLTCSVASNPRTITLQSINWRGESGRRSGFHTNYL
jgi:hypothetical protein